MNPTAIYSKTGKGVQEASGRTSHLSRADRAVLSAIDGKSTVAELNQRFEKISETKFQQLIEKMDKDGFVREVSPGAAVTQPRPAASRTGSHRTVAPPPKQEEESDGGELDFTSFIPTAPRQAAAQPKATPPAGESTSQRLDLAAKAHAEAERKAQDEAFDFRAREKAEAKAKEEAAARAKAEAKAKEEAAARAKAEAEARAKAETAAKEKAEAEARAKAAAEARAKAEAEAKAKAEAEAKARADSEAKSKALRDAAIRAASEARQKAEAEAKAKAEAEERANKEAEERARIEQEMNAKLEAERKAREEAEQKVKEEAERAAKEAEARARREVEEKARQEAEALRQQLEAERKAREEVERKAREEEERRRAEEEARRRKEAEEARRRDAEEAKRREAEEAERKAAEAARRKEDEERKRKDAEEAARRETEEAIRRQSAEAQRRKDEEQAKRRAEEEARREAQEAAKAPAASALSDDLLADLDSFAKRDEEQQRAREAAEREAKEKAQAAEARKRQEEETRRQREDEARRRDEENRRREAADAQARADAEARAQREREEQEKEEAERERRRRQLEEAAGLTAQPEIEDDIGISEEDLDLDEVRSEERLLSKSARKAQAKRAREEADEIEPAPPPEKKKKDAKALFAFLKPKERKPAKPKKAKDAKPVAPKAVQAERIRRRKLGKPIGIALLVLVAAGLGALHVMPISTASYASSASAALGVPVRIASARMSLVTGPEVRLEGITIGEGADAVRVVRAIGHPDIASLVSFDVTFSRIELEGVAVPQARIGGGLLGSLKGGALRVEHIVLKQARFEGPMTLPPLDVTLEIAGDGRIARAVVEGVDGIEATLVPKGNEIAVEAKADALNLPFLQGVTLADVGLKGSATRDALHLSAWDARLFDGVISGNGELRWGAQWSFSGDLVGRGVNAAVFLPALLSEGKADAKGRFSMAGPDPQALGRSARVEGSFTISKGVLGSFDLSRAIQTKGKQSSGRTIFSELSGEGTYQAGAVSLRNLNMGAGKLNAAGTVEIEPGGEVRGRVVADVESGPRAINETFNLVGTTTEPRLSNPTR